MLNDLYLMSVNPSLEAAARRYYTPPTLTDTEMVAFCKRRESTARERMKRTARKNIFLAILEWVTRT